MREKRNEVSEKKGMEYESKEQGEVMIMKKKKKTKK